MTQNVYNYKPLSFNYLSTEPATPDPFYAGKYIVPAFATTTPVPAIPTGQMAFFISDAWVMRTAPGGGASDTFFYLGAPTVHYTVGEAFTYGSNVYRDVDVTEELLIYLGFTRVEIQAKPTLQPGETLSGPNDDGSWTIIPAPPEPPRDLPELKAESIARTGDQVRSLLSVSDWIILANLAESGPAVPADIVTYRQSLRTTAANRITAFNAVTSLAEYDALWANIDTNYAWPTKPTFPDF